MNWPKQPFDQLPAETRLDIVCILYEQIAAIGAFAHDAGDFEFVLRDLVDQLMVPVGPIDPRPLAKKFSDRRTSRTAVDRYIRMLADSEPPPIITRHGRFADDTCLAPDGAFVFR